jgi:MoxR-like ATPase
VLDEVDTVIVGKRAATEVVLAGVLAGGHVLMEDYPGLGKTLAARTFAQALGLDFTRAQFTPDLLPGDLTGSFVYDQGRGEFEFRKGPVFTGFLLADEINRTPPKTQAALHQVTVEGQTFPLPRPFHVLATANPVEYEGTYPLPEAQLDRFLVRVAFGYPDAEGEWEVLGRRMARRQEDQQVRQVVDAAELLELQASLEDVTVSPEVGRYCVALTRATRDHEHALMGASPRGSLALMLVGRAYAVIRGRDYVTPDDVKAIAPAVLEHRVVVRPELWMSEVSSRSIVADLLRSVLTPRTGARSS